jgi:hypothetical protein
MTVTVTAKTQTISNGTANDGSIVNQMFTDCYDNAGTLASYINTHAALVDASNTFTTTQTFSAKVTLSNGVNLSESTDPTTPIAGDAFYSATNSAFEGITKIGTVSGATNASPIVITTAASHNLVTGNTVQIYDVLGNTAANGKFVVTVTGPTTFSLNGSTGNAAYTSGGTVAQWQTFLSVEKATLPNRYRGTAAPVYASSSTFTVAFIEDRDSTNAVDILKNTSTTLDFTTLGLNGIAQSSNLTGTIAYTNGSATVTGTGTSFSTEYVAGDTMWDQTNSVAVGVVLTVGSNTSITLRANYSGTSHSGGNHRRGCKAAGSIWYLYSTTDGATPGMILSNRNVAGSQSLVDLPSGYSYTRQQRFAAILDTSANLFPFYVSNSGGMPSIFFRDFDNGSSTYRVLNAGIATTAFTNPGGGTNIDLSSWMPKISKEAFISGQMSYSSGSGTWSTYLKSPDSTSTSGKSVTSVNSVGESIGIFNERVPTNSSQQIAYRVDAQSVSMYIQGFTVTEVS